MCAHSEPISYLLCIIYYFQFYFRIFSHIVIYILNFESQYAEIWMQVFILVLAPLPFSEKIYLLT